MIDRPRFLDVCCSDGLTLRTAALKGPDAVEHRLAIGYSSHTPDTIDRADARLGQLLRAH